MDQPSPTHHRPQPDLKKEKHAATRVTLIGMFLDAFLGVIKVIGGTLFHSQALVVDGIHSFTEDRKSTRLNSSHVRISYAVYCLKKNTAKLCGRIRLAAIATR